MKFLYEVINDYSNYISEKRLKDIKSHKWEIVERYTQEDHCWVDKKYPAIEMLFVKCSKCEKKYWFKYPYSNDDFDLLSCTEQVIKNIIE